MKGSDISMTTLYNIYFSAKGTTKLCAGFIGERLGMKMEETNWLKKPGSSSLELAEDDVLLFTMPVYGGFIPKLCADMAENLKGNGTPAIIAAVYGNRHYDDALIQMKDILQARGFKIIAAGAFLAEHSIFPAVGAGRPDDDDKKAMADFAAECRNLLAKRESWQDEELRVPGTRDYDAASFGGVPLKPDGSRKCTECGECVKLCPTNAISAENPRKTDSDRCISCGACIKVCPEGARDYHGAIYKAAGMQFKKQCAEYRKPEVYYISLLK